MLSFFRRALGSWVVVALLGLVMVAFIVTGVGNPGSFGGGSAGDPDVVATVGGQPVPSAEVARRAETDLAEARQRRPDATMAQMLGATGGVAALVDQAATGRLLEVWADKQGLVASDRLVDAEIAAIPAFRSPSGAFYERQMNAVLAQQRMTLPSLRSGIRGDLLRRHLLVPMTTGVRAPQGLSRAYAALMLARRSGEIGFVPLDPAAVPAPTAADIATWYAGHLAAYSLPERRVLRYAPVALENVAVSPPSEAEIAAQYSADAAKYGAGETRILAQVVLPDEAAARAFAAKVGAGTPFAKAAADAGFAAGDIALGKQTKAAFAGASAPAIADAAFAAAPGAVVGPLKSVLGWHVVHVDAVERTATRSLAQVRGEITDALLKKRRTEALAATAQKMEDALADGATFDEVVRANRLTVTATPPLTAAGAVPGQPGYKPDATALALLKPGFQASPEDQPSLETVSPERFALLGVGAVTPAAPVPLDTIRSRVIADLVASRAAVAAKGRAQAIVDKANKGAAFASTLAAAGLKPPQTVNASQIETMQLQQVPPPLRLLFTLAPGRAGLIAAPGGYFVVRFDHAVDGPAQAVPGIAAQLAGELDQAIGSELVEQFARALRKDVPIKRNPAAIMALGRQLTGQAAQP